MREYSGKCFISGDWVKTKDSLPLTDPYKGIRIGEVSVANSDDVDNAVQSAKEASEIMAELPAFRRAEILKRVPGILLQRADELAEAMARQTGKALKECRGEVQRSAATMELCSEEAKRIMGEVIPLDAVSSGVGKFGFTMRFPVGLIAAITPFNAPVNLACHKIGPALAAGNSVVFKPPLEGSIVSQILVNIFLEAGVPPTALQMVHGGSETGTALISHPKVDLINFTGSAATAHRIITNAGLKRTLFELGGSGATIIHNDANLKKAVEGIVRGAFGLTGQSCTSVQRVYVHDTIMDNFTNALVEKTKQLKVGDPLNEDTDIGTLISENAAIRVESWVQEAIDQGAELLIGGKRKGAAFEPTILINVVPSARIVCEEVFGPTVSILPYNDIVEAINNVNDSPSGLQAGIYTASLDIAMLAARQIHVGGLNINGPSRGRTDLQPFGGVKQSGWGREGPRYAIVEMTTVKMITFTQSN